jgi:NAD(P)H-hydrate epimerase
VGGSRGMSGAIALAGMATLRSGAGLVRLAVPDACLDVVAGFDPCYMTTPLAGDLRGRIVSAAKETIDALATDATCIACGPGMGRSDQLTDLVRYLYESIVKPMVFDADALNAIAPINGAPAVAPAPRILTPHPGEFRRLVGDPIAQLPQRLLRERAVQLAGQWRVVLVLKGHQTLITDGQRIAENTTGNPGMATGGSGDVLTGVITALVCQGLDAFAAAQLGVYVHGLAGDLGVERLGQVSLTASDLITYLPDAFKRVAGVQRFGGP